MNQPTKTTVTGTTNDDRGLLVHFIYLAICKGWNEYFSSSAFGGTVGRNKHKWRDIRILVMIIFSCCAFVTWNTRPNWHTLQAGWAFYRTIDLFFALTSLACFGIIREPNKLPDLGSQRLERTLVFTFLSYIEIMINFATIYLWVDLKIPESFEPSLGSSTAAFMASMSTMTTVGYGTVAPAKMWATGLATLQAMLAIMMLVVLVGSIVALKLADSTPPKNPPPPPTPPSEHFLCPILPFLVIVGVIQFLT